MGFSPVGGLKGDLVAALPESVKIIVSTTVGMDPYDIQALGSRGIVVCNAPGHAADPVADHVLYLTLSLFRYSQVFEHVTKHFDKTTDGRANLKTNLPWNQETGRPVFFSELTEAQKRQFIDNKPPFNFGECVGDRFVRSPRGHTVGIAGFGSIGKEIGARLHALGMHIHYTKRDKLTETQLSQLGYPTTHHASLDSMLPICDLLVLALPLTQQTTHIIDKSALSKLPDGARIINIGRGKLIDEHALLDALRAGKLANVGLDVFENEPLVLKDLQTRWDTVLTPHVGSSTYEIAVAAENTCTENLSQFFYGDKLGITAVNTQYLK